jgi:Ca2+-transporting ATPase
MENSLSHSVPDPNPAAPGSETEGFHRLPVADVLRILGSSGAGLPEEEVSGREAQWGPNRLPDARRLSLGALVFRQFSDVMVLVLLAAAGISWVVGDLNDALVIGLIILLNTTLGFFHEYRAEKAVQALQRLAPPVATVRRSGRVKVVQASSLVPGDVVLIEAGCVVPADLRLMVVNSLRLEEASLTGESVPVEKTTAVVAHGESLAPGDRINMVFKGTVVTYGRGEGVVVATGMRTEMGKIARLLQEEKMPTPLQKRLSDLGRKVSIVVLAICAVLFVSGWYHGGNPVTLLLTAISVAVAAIPEALPAVITIALSLGARRMVRLQVLIRKLPAVETLGSVSYICTDKTGTLTCNRMRVTDTRSFAGTGEPVKLRLAMELNHDLQLDGEGHYFGDPTEMAIMDFVSQQEREEGRVHMTWPRVAECPFDSDRKRMTTVHFTGSRYLVVTKGAWETVFSVCCPFDSHAVSEQARIWAGEGKRVLAYACATLDALPADTSVRSLENGLVFLGLAAMEDPPRPEAFAAIAECHSAGIIPVMITGDHPVTAAAIARKVGILRHSSERVMSGSEIAALPPEEFEKVAGDVRVFARVSPEQKLRIVEAIQKSGRYVAMTGDGVNDSPSLKRADIGIAMGVAGSDVSKEAADMILLDDNFASIVAAVKEGRHIYDNIRKFVCYALTCNSGEIWALALAPMMGLPLPLLPIQILWINLVTDGLPGLALTSEPAEADILRRPPQKAHESLFGEGMLVHILWIGMLIGALSLVTQFWAQYAAIGHGQSMVFTVLSFSQLSHAIAIRSTRQSVFRLPFSGNPLLLLSIGFTLLLHIAILYVPAAQAVFKTQALSLGELLGCLALSTLVFWAVELQKIVLRFRNQRRRK